MAIQTALLTDPSREFCAVAVLHSRLNALTYRLPKELQAPAKPGSAVRVELQQRETLGIITGFTLPPPVPVKDVLEIVEPDFCPEELVHLAQWLSDYYLSSLSETLRFFFPEGVIGYRPRNPWKPGTITLQTGRPPTLTVTQHQAVNRILEALQKKQFRPFLLFGALGAGKTECYLRAVEAALRTGRSAIVILPEITLTPLTVQRFEERFPGQYAVLHSGLRASLRKASWQAVRDGSIRLVIGTRSAVFAPVRDLGLIVVDEEHDPSFKERERSPHYHARDVAVMRAKLAEAVVVLSSASPSIESFHNARTGRYELLNLIEQKPRAQTPKAVIISMRQRKSDVARASEAGRAGHRYRQVVSPALATAIKKLLTTPGQAILLVNRRGFASQIVCTECGYVARCQHCRLPLSLHRSAGTIQPQQSGSQLQCHICGFTLSAPDICPNCRGASLETGGVGTERVVHELKRLAPNETVLRLDRDAVRAPNALHQTLELFAQGKARFLVGTVMAARALDVPQVLLYAVVSADALLNQPDFRAAERTFQLLYSIALRLNSGDRQRRAIFQTLHPDHYAFVCAAQQNYEGFYRQELKFRRNLRYPPFSRLVLIRLRSRSSSRLAEVCRLLRPTLAEHPGIQVLGPVPLLRNRHQDLHCQLMLLRAQRTIRLSSIIDPQRRFPQVRLDIDVDPIEIT